MGSIKKFMSFGLSTRKAPLSSQSAKTEDITPNNLGNKESDRDEMSSSFIHPTDFNGEKTPAIERMKQYFKQSEIADN